MTKFTHILGAASIAVALGLTSFTTASAAPVVTAPVQIASDAQLVQYRDERPRWKKRMERRHDRRVERREERRGYWRGHRGYREARRGYRRHSDGYYYAPEVFRLVIR